MNASEKADMLKDTIEVLYTEEGRSLSYIERLLKINRRVVSKKVKEWGFEQNKSIRHLTPSNQKWVDSHREQVLSLLKRDDKSFKQIANDLGISYDRLRHLVKSDKVLCSACDKKNARAKATADLRKQEITERRREPEDLPGEQWKPVLGYSDYMVSNLGRAKSHKLGYWELLVQSPNKNTKRLYVSMVDDNGKSHNLLLARVVGFVFCPEHSSEKNTINHIDGNFCNNRADNLEWVSQAENDLHAYRQFNRAVVDGKRYELKEIVFKGKYHFKTVAAFARFIGKSETQTRRYLDDPEKHDIKLIL